MKTNQIMLRRMGDFKVEQRTKDGFFNATSLLRQWNSANFTIDEFLNSEDVKDMGNTYEGTLYEIDDGGVWCCRYMFNELLILIDPVLFFVELPCALYSAKWEYYLQLALEIDGMKYRRSPKDVITYILTDNSGLYKIGSTTNLNERLKQLSIGNPNIQLCFYLKCDVERILHDKFASKRVKGEWFKLTKEDLAYMRKKWTDKWCPKMLR